jgi:predicted dehydrogenase
LQGKKIRVGIVGAGFITNLAHIPNWRKFPDVEIVALCDLDEARGKEACAQNGISKFYTDVSKMLEAEQLDLADICTPPMAHAKIAKECLSAGVSCAIEKPITVTTSEADEILQTAQARNCKIFPLQTYSYLPCVRKYKDWITAGKLGDIIRVSTSYFVNLEQERYTGKGHWIYSLPGGILSSEITPHLLMLVLELVGNFDSIELVENDLAGPEVEIVIKTKRALGTVGLSFNSRFGMQIGDVLGAKAYVHTDYFAQTSVLHSFNASPTSIATRGMWATTEIKQRTADLFRVSFGALTGKYSLTTEGHRFLFSKIIESLRDGREYPVKYQDAREVVRAMEVMFAGKATK